MTASKQGSLGAGRSYASLPAMHQSSPFQAMQQLPPLHSLALPMHEQHLHQQHSAPEAASSGQ